MSGKGDLDERFWNLVAELGYPSSPKGIEYGSKKYKVYMEIKWIWRIAKALHRGERIGWIAGTHYSMKSREYQGVYLVAKYVLGGWSKLKETFVENLEREYSRRKLSVEGARRDLENLKAWASAGGKITGEDVGKVIAYLKDIEDCFNRKMWNDVERILSVIGISEERIVSIRREFTRFIERLGKEMEEIRKDAGRICKSHMLASECP